MTIDETAVTAFLVHEARLLDEGRFDAWLALFDDRAWYWVPSQPDQKSPKDTVSLIYDDRRLLETRVRRLSNPALHAQVPRSRTSRIVANVAIESAATKSSLTARSKLLMIEYRRNQQRTFAATCFHGLRRENSSFVIEWKRVDLVNCDAELDGIVVPF
jgi:3-phenylpropionate/cinnamic acid dioxygenase small subunit